MKANISSEATFTVKPAFNRFRFFLNTDYFLKYKRNNIVTSHSIPCNRFVIFVSFLCRWNKKVNKVRKFFEKIVEGGLLISGSVSSFTILLIVFFLFKEAGGLFNTPATEEGYVLAVNKSNDVGKLSPEKIMDIFDGNITNWKDISGMDQDILIFRFSDLTNYYTEEELGDEFQYVPQKISELVAKEPGIIAFFPNSIYWKTIFRERYCRKRRSH